LATGGLGRDVVIGGDGSDLLLGDFDDDIMIAGTTAFDANEVALGLIMAEWTSSRSFQQRVANLEGTGSGSSWTNRANSNTFLVADPGSPHHVTVFDDNACDLLLGGADRDWFFANYAGPGTRDLIADLTSRDVADDLQVLESLDQ
jgi:Ca2+-binding RTX toxin-like protein